jgi:hypothetical protein
MKKCYPILSDVRFIPVPLYQKSLPDNVPEAKQQPTKSGGKTINTERNQNGTNNQPTMTQTS